VHKLPGVGGGLAEAIEPFSVVLRVKVVVVVASAAVASPSLSSASAPDELLTMRGPALHRIAGKTACNTRSEPSRFVSSASATISGAPA
jgi:hypothetical protein